MVVAVTTAPAVTLAQLVRGRVLDGSTGQPLLGAVVIGRAGHDDSAAVVFRALSDATGRFFWRAPTAGRYQLEIRSIGFVPAQREVTLAPAETLPFEVALERAPLKLATIHVAGRNSCTARRELPVDASILWDDVWSALSAAVASRETRQQVLRLMRYVRVRRWPGDIVEREDRSYASGTSDQSFVAETAADLAKSGFRVENDDGSQTFYGPDAETLTAPEFIARHCFAPTRSDSAGVRRVGIAFWPLRRYESIDVEGVLWVDAATRQLQQLEFTYPALRDVDDGRLFGGFASYARQADGTWIIDAWQIRVPVVFSTQRVVVLNGRRFGASTENHVVNVSEEGGVAAWPGSPRQLGVIAGHVRVAADAISSGITVELVGTDIAALTDRTGGFRLAGVLPGRYTIRATRPSDNFTGAILAESVIDIGRGDSVVWAPEASEADAIRAACPDRSRRSRDGVLVAVMRNAATQRPLPGQRLQLSATIFSGDSISRMRRRDETFERTSDHGGLVVVCSVPTNAFIRIRRPGQQDWMTAARYAGSFSLVSVEVDTATSSLAVAAAERSIPFVEPPGPVTRSRGSIIGRVVSEDSVSQPLFGAEVVLGGSSKRFRTSADGVFRFDDVPVGPVVLGVRHLGFVPAQRAVDVGPSSGDTVAIRLSRVLALLDPVRVEAAGGLVSSGMREFAARRRAGFGAFVDAADIEKSRAGNLSSVVLASAGGLELVRINVGGVAGGGYAAVSRRYHSMSTGRGCFSQVFLNGARVYPQASAGDKGLAFSSDSPFVLDQIPIDQILGVEIYKGAADTPLEFSGPSAACGTVVIWTR